MARVFFKGFYVTCGCCKHRNRPAKSPREGIRMALLNALPDCRKCGKRLSLTQPSDRPLVREVRAELIRDGLLPGPADDQDDWSEESAMDAIHGPGWSHGHY